MKKITLKVSCPHCTKSLITDDFMINNYPSIKVNVENDHGRGILWLSSVYDDHTHTSNLEMKDGESVKMYCPHCNKDLVRDIKCEVCNSPIISFNCSIGGKVSICSNNGCKNHYVVFNDLSTLISKFYNEYGE